MVAPARGRLGRVDVGALGQRVHHVDAGLGQLVLRPRKGDAAGAAEAFDHARGQLELRVNDMLPDPTARILTICEFGRISTLAAATLRDLGFTRAAALDGGVKAWREAGLPLVGG